MPRVSRSGANASSSLVRTFSTQGTKPTNFVRVPETVYVREVMQVFELEKRLLATDNKLIMHARVHTIFPTRLVVLLQVVVHMHLRMLL